MRNPLFFGKSSWWIPLLLNNLLMIIEDFRALQMLSKYFQIVIFSLFELLIFCWTSLVLKQWCHGLSLSRLNHASRSPQPCHDRPLSIFGHYGFFQFSSFLLRGFLNRLIFDRKMLIFIFIFEIYFWMNKVIIEPYKNPKHRIARG